jgi:flagellar hook-associated protein 2
MAISSPGIGSGLDINGIISKLMQVEQQPFVKLTTKEASYQSKISALGSLQGAVSSLNSAVSALALSGTQTANSKYSTIKSSLGDSSVGTVTNTQAATPGSHDLEVLQVGKAHRISTTATAQMLMSTGPSFTDADEFIGEGEMAITVNGVTKNIVINEYNDTLGGLRDAINAANAGVTAEIVEDAEEGGVRLALTSQTAGTAGRMELSGFPGFEYDPENDFGDFSDSAEDGGQEAVGGFANADSAVGEGTLELMVGSAMVEIEIDESNNTLGGLRDAINAAGAGVTASLRTVGTNDVRLVLTSNTMGTDQKISLSGLDGYMFDGTSGYGEGFSEAEADGGQTAQNSLIRFDGILKEGTSNTFEDLAPGVNLTIKATTDSPTTLTISRDASSALTAAMTNIVKAYNDLNSTIRNLGNYNAETKQGGPLLGNSTLRTTANSIRNTFQSVFGASGSNYKRLSDLGLEIQKDGSITFDTAKLTSATNTDFDAVGALAANFGNTAKTLTASMLGTGGSITAATDGAKASIKSIDKQRETLAARLTQVEARYRKQFTALDTLMASMNSTSNYLAQQLSSLPSMSSSQS